MFLYKRGVNMAKPNQRAKILEYVETVYNENGYPPSLSEIAAYLRLKSRTNIYYQLQQLCETGSLINSKGRYIPSSLYAGQKAGVAMVPLLGTVAAGTPITAIEDLDGYVAYLPRFGDSKDLFALTVKGESMIDLGINDGDIVVVEKTPVAANGEIVVALIEDEATVKRFYRENGHFRLQPENKTMEPIIVQDVVVLGKVVSCMRYY
jgi:repressor LexA